MFDFVLVQANGPYVLSNMNRFTTSLNDTISENNTTVARQSSIALQRRYNAIPIHFPKKVGLSFSSTQIRETTYRRPLLPQRTKSILSHSEVSPGVSNLVYVAKFFETAWRGAFPRKSTNVKPLPSLPVLYFVAKVVLIATGDAAPVMIIYPPEPEPVEGLEKEQD